MVAMERRVCWESLEAYGGVQRASLWSTAVARCAGMRLERAKARRVGVPEKVWHHVLRMDSLDDGDHFGTHFKMGSKMRGDSFM